MSVFRHLEDYLKERFASHPVSEIVSRVEADVKKLIDEATAPLRDRITAIENKPALDLFAKSTEAQPVLDSPPEKYIKPTEFEQAILNDYVGERRPAEAPAPFKSVPSDEHPI